MVYRLVLRGLGNADGLAQRGRNAHVPRMFSRGLGTKIDITEFCVARSPLSYHVTCLPLVSSFVAGS